MFRRFCAPLLFLLLILAPTRLAFPQPLPDRAPLIGVVLDPEGNPIAGALVSLKRAQTNSAVAFWGALVQSDKEGKFVFPDAEEGDYEISVQLLNPIFPIYDFDTTELKTSWRLGSPPVRVMTRQSAYLSFSLLAPDGSPLAADTPAYWQFRHFDALWEITYSFDRAKADGQVSITDKKPGRYLLYLRSPQGIALIQGDSTVKPATASRVVQLQPGGALHLKVTDENGQPLGGAKLSLALAKTDETRPLQDASPLTETDISNLAETQNGSALVSRDGDGTIDLTALPPAFYSLQLSLPGYIFENSAPFSIVAGEVFNAEIKAISRPARTLELQLYTSEHKPFVAGEVSLRISPVTADGNYTQNTPPALDAFGDLPASPFDWGRRVLPDAQGRVTIFPVKTGRYRIFATSKSDFFEAVPTDVAITAAGGKATVIVNTTVIVNN